MLIHQLNLQLSNQKLDNDYEEIKNKILKQNIDPSNPEQKYIILFEKAERVVYSESCCFALVDWFNFSSEKKTAVIKNVEDLMNRLLQDEAVIKKISEGSRLTIHTRVEKRESDLNSTIDEERHGGYMRFNRYTYYVAELRLDWSTSRFRCLPSSRLQS